MTTESSQSGSPIPDIAPMPRYSVKEYIKNPVLMKRINEWLLNSYRDRLIDSQHQLRKLEISLDERGQELVKKDADLQLARQEINQLRDVSIIQFGLGIL